MRRRWTRTRAGLGAVMLAALAVGCTVETDKKEPPASGPAGAPGGGPGRSPGGGVALAVKIDNVPQARPQTGLDTADVVYVEQVEAGLSRLMGVYASRLPAAVGPVRSARETDLELLRQFDTPVLAFSGAQSKLLPLIAGAPLRAVPPEKAAEDAYYRDDARAAPHDLFVRPGALKVVPQASALESTGFRFGPRPAGGTPETHRTIRFPSARFAFDWVEYEGRWRITMDGERARTSAGKELAASTVVVQYTKVRPSQFHDRSGNVSPFTETVGEGGARVLRDGHAYEARWKRASAEDGTRFTTPDGRPLPFAKGQVWVVYAQP
ncbi:MULTISPECIES: DUF3048 domain-containing protein [Streptomyces]|uniref:DUF3048 domain-containing protein n=1 Tax=Streptomyces TaxID=1883 RepID=UPI001E2937AB|nr:MULTISPECIES: DUF3048 domain-containing protein [Streptomyces]UFQ19300.1 DUF3048 domain-containing protein [Streptomyces huasconensis]WCL88919.1 DUF3048 domain-containing protein [Streptomyces sp. JCM 35825]